MTKEQLVNLFHSFLLLKSVLLPDEAAQLYWTESDKELLEELPFSALLQAYKRIDKTLSQEYHSLLGGDICPFCQAELDCADCPYGRAKGICFYPDSTYKQVLSILRQKPPVFSSNAIQKIWETAKRVNVIHGGC